MGLIAASAVQAHPQIFHASGFVHGLLHPWTGADHWLAMIAVASNLGLDSKATARIAAARACVMLSSMKRGE